MCCIGVCSATTFIFLTTLGVAKHLIDMGLSPLAILPSFGSNSGKEDRLERLRKTLAIKGRLQCSVSFSSIPGHSASTRRGALTSSCCSCSISFPSSTIS
uniref:Uncharacterized protein n=1 Tax=Opuntia streptacantha TaxID=393608 RepID=A0A7C8ZYC4_OPUST